MNLHFYQCDICRKVIAILPESEIPTECCGQPMRELIPNRTDGALEKHVPVPLAAGTAVSVKIGSVPHPMTDSHLISWVGLRTADGFQFRELHPGDLPEAEFRLAPGDRALAVYAFCNLHGLWCLDLKAEG